MTGQRFGRLVVLHRVPAIGQAQWLTRCDCGNERVVRGQPLRSGGTVSCGCWRSERIAAQNTRHGHARRGHTTATYGSWVSMKRRCLDPDDQHWPSYGGRGIAVCPQWMDFSTFHADMGDRPTGMTLNRIDNDGNYEPSNCEWAKPVEQSQNTRLTHVMTKDGRSQSLSAWARDLGLSRRTIQDRLAQGMTDKEALTVAPPAAPG